MEPLLTLPNHIIKVFRKGKILSLVQWNPTVITHSNEKEKSKIRFVHTAHVLDHKHSDDSLLLTEGPLSVFVKSHLAASKWMKCQFWVNYPLSRLLHFFLSQPASSGPLSIGTGNSLDYRGFNFRVIKKKLPAWIPATCNLLVLSTLRTTAITSRAKTRSIPLP